jgi:hypothetical protein
MGTKKSLPRLTLVVTGSVSLLISISYFLTAERHVLPVQKWTFSIFFVAIGLGLLLGAVASFLPDTEEPRPSNVTISAAAVLFVGSLYFSYLSLTTPGRAPSNFGFFFGIIVASFAVGLATFARFYKDEHLLNLFILAVLVGSGLYFFLYQQLGWVLIPMENRILLYGFSVSAFIILVILETHYIN